MTLPAGTRLGSYEILDAIGAGGMGEVYRALDTKLRREVAIKILPEAFSQDAERLARFEREARLLAALNNPSIATIYGMEQEGGRGFIVMELVDGQDLGARLGAGPLPASEALRIARQIAEALEAAHARGVIHCDLKPANVALTRDGRVKLLDFGLARAFAPERTSTDLSHSPTITADLAPAGNVFGTVSYMSPEQARGREIDKRTDLWAFGCVLFEMLSGRKAFTGESIPDTLAAIFEAEPDWGALPPRVPGRVRELLRRCIQKDPNRRLRDAGDARIELDESFSGQTHELPETSWRRSSRKTAVWAATAAALAAVAVVLLLRGRRPETAAPRSLAVLPFRNLTGEPSGELMGAGLAETVSVRLANVPGLNVVTPRAASEAVQEGSDFAKVARRLGATTLLSGTLQRENERFRITYRILDATGQQIAANALDGSELFALQDRVADGVARDLRLRAGGRRTPVPTGLDTTSQQERYLQALGLLQRYDRRDGIERAVEILRPLAEENPQSALVQAAVGRANLAMFDFTKDRTWADKAVRAADAARTLDPALPEVDVIRGETLLATGRPADALEAFRRALSQRPSDVDALLGLGRASQLAGDDAAAEAQFRRAVELQPGFAVFNQLGALYADHGRWTDAAAMFRRATQVAPDSYRAYSNLGGVSVLACDFPSALTAFRQALRLRPTDPVAASNLGMTQLWTGRTAEAAATLEAAVKQAPKDWQILANYADALTAQGQTEKARDGYERSIALCREAIALNPTDPVAHSSLGTSLARLGRGDEASKQIQTALALDQKEPSVLWDAAVVSMLRGRTPEALTWLRKAADAGYCREIIARQPEFASVRESAEFRAIVAGKR
ncbi:MAG TPA: protein kinase [Thermoanaerobaculia bacterium]|nr:protein kinase [Thermoanaerobaculia bacterium]